MVVIEKLVTKQNLMFLVFFLSIPLRAAEYSLEPKLSVVSLSNTNFRLLVADEQSLAGFSFNPGLKAEVKEADWSVALDLDLDFFRFNRDQFDTDDQVANLSASKEGEKYLLQASLAHTRDTTRTSEEQDSGIVGDVDRLEIDSLFLSGRYSLTGTDSLTMSVSFSELEYEAGSPRSNYENIQGRVGWTHQFSELLQLSFDGSVSEIKFEPSELNVTLFRPVFFGPVIFDVDIIDVGLQSRQTVTDATSWIIGLDYQLTEAISLESEIIRRENKNSFNVSDPLNFCGRSLEDPTLMFGPGSFCIEQPDQENTVTSGNFTLNWALQRQNLNITYSNSVTPSSNGFVQESETAGLTWRYQLNGLDSISVSILYRENKSLDVPDGVDPAIINRTFSSGSIRYSRQLNKAWVVRVGADYREQDRELISGSANDFGGAVSVTYRPTKFIWSR